MSASIGHTYSSQDSPVPAPSALVQVRKGLALNRIPGWNFPGNFLEISFDEVADGASRLSLEPAAWLVDGDGQMGLAPLAILADIGLAATMRENVGFDTRMATVAMSLQLTGASRRGRLEAHGRFDGFVRDIASRMGLARAEIRGEAGLVAAVQGSFVALGNREGTKPLPMRRRGVDPEVPPLAVEDLAGEERAVYERALAAAAEGDAGFVERFWSLRPRREGRGAVCVFENGLHVGNRVGHTQGGITFALGALTAAAALGPGWRLVASHAWYLSPGVGATLRAESEVVHEGRITGAARSRIVDGEGRTVLETVTQHARISPPARGSGTAG